MAEIGIGLILLIIFLVGLVITGGVVLRLLMGIGGVSKRALKGIATQSGPVKGEWRGLLLPVPQEALIHPVDLNGEPIPANVHVAEFVIPGSRVATIAQWFQDNWTGAGLILEDAPQTPNSRWYSFRDPQNNGKLEIGFQLGQKPSMVGSDSMDSLETTIMIADSRPR